MKKFLTIISLLLSLFFANAAEISFASAPTVSAKEAECIAEASAQSDKSEALRILKVASARKWAGAGIWFNLGNMQMSTDDVDGAIESYQNALKLSPSFFAARKNLAFALERVGDSNGAFEEMKNALALSGGSDVAILTRMIAYHSSARDFSSALSLCNQALIYDSKNKSLRLAKAIFLFELENFLECEKICVDILSSDYTNVEVLRLLGKSRAKRGDFCSAVSSFEMLKKSGKALDSDISFLGDLFFRENLYTLAFENYIIAKKDALAQNVALAALYSGDVESALKMSKHFDSPFKEKLEGLAYFELAKFDKALELLKKYLTVHSDDSVCILRAADAALSLGRFDDATDYFSRVELDGKYKAQSHYGLIRVALGKGDYRSALQIAKRLQKINTDSEISDYIKRLEEYVSKMD